MDKKIYSTPEMEIQDVELDRCMMQTISQGGIEFGGEGSDDDF